MIGPGLSRAVPKAPDSNPELKRPAREQRDPTMLRAEREAARIFDAWVRRGGYSNSSLGESMGVDESIVRELRSGAKPLRLGHLLKLPRGAARTRLFALLEDASVPDAAEHAA